MEINQIDSTRLLKAIRGTNAHFHLHKEDDKAFKSHFYKIKDAIIKQLLTNNVEFGVNYYLLDCLIDNTHNTYTLVEFKTDDINVLVHVPIKMCPHILGFSTGDFNPYVRHEEGYKKFDISDDEFKVEFQYLEEIFKDLIYNKRVNSLSDWEILGNLKSSAGKVGIRPCLYNNETPDKCGRMYFETKKRGRFLYDVDVKLIRKAAFDCLTFNYTDIYRYLTSNGYVKQIKM